MPTIVKDICAAMETWAPLNWQESYDNAGLLVGNKETEVTGILVSLDCTEEVVDEAIAKGCNVIVSHHPIIFKGLKSLTGKNYVEKTVIKAIQHNIALYASHTNLDHAPKGVSYHLAQKLKVNGQTLSPLQNTLKKLSFFVPVENKEKVLEALHAAGAGNIGNYSNCSFTSVGEGRFTPENGSNPSIGTVNQAEKVEEAKIEILFPKHLEGKILTALRENHPYEEVAYFVTSLDNVWEEVGSGYVGQLEHPMNEDEFIQWVKKALGLSFLRHTPKTNKLISKVAVCGGAGSFLIKDAIACGADAYISADIKYHEFFDAEGRLILLDIGHYESEVMIKEAMCSYLSNIF